MTIIRHALMGFVGICALPVLLPLLLFYVFFDACRQIGATLERDLRK